MSGNMSRTKKKISMSELEGQDPTISTDQSVPPPESDMVDVHMTPAETVRDVNQNGPTEENWPPASDPPPPETGNRVPLVISLGIHILLLVAAICGFALGIYLWVRWPLDQFIFVAQSLIFLSVILFLLCNLGLMFTASSRRVVIFLYLVLIISFIILYVHSIRRIDGVLVSAGKDWAGSDANKLVFERTLSCCGYTSIDDGAVLPCPTVPNVPCEPLIGKWASIINRASWNVLYTILALEALHMIILLIIMAKGQPKRHEQVLA